MQKIKADVVIIGGGAAGLAAAVMLLQLNRDRKFTMVILEKGQRVGRKLLATGNGTCNISNLQAAIGGYHCSEADFTDYALQKFSPQRTMEFFASVGVECEARADGRVYPITAQAAAVLDCLRLQLQADGVKIICEQQVRQIRQGPDSFLEAVTADYAVKAGFMICAAGGLASPALGGCADGYELLTALGLRKIPLTPAIVQLKTAVEPVKALQGIRINGRASLWEEGRQICAADDEILFTAYGLSGPAVLQLSRQVGLWERQKKSRLQISLDLLPQFSAEWVLQKLRERQALNRRLEDYLTGFLQKRLGQTVLKAAGMAPLSAPAAELCAEELQKLAAFIKDWRIDVTGTKGWGEAQVTAGGICCTDIDRRTMRSKRLTGLYVIGEVLDVDGACGGYNLQWAWSSAWLAASDISRRLLRQESHCLSK